MSKHTPGPWRIGTPPPNGEQTIGTQHGLMVAVATTGYDVQTTANARLIAAAPDLLDALFTALPFVEDAADDEIYKSHRVHAVLRKIRSAIFKATGEQS